MATSPFESYLGTLNNTAAGGASNTSSQTVSTPFIFGASGDPGSDNYDPRLDPNSPSYGGGGVNMQSKKGKKGIPQQIDEGFADASNVARAGTQGAGQLLQQAYQDLFTHRANSIVGASRESANRLSADATATGMSANLARKQLLEKHADTVGMLGDAMGDAKFQQGMDLASLLKGSATEQAGLITGKVGQQIDYEAARRGAAATASAGKMSALAGFAGGALSLL